jgi:hypothetical protein
LKRAAFHYPISCGNDIPAKMTAGGRAGAAT